MKFLAIFRFKKPIIILEVLHQLMVALRFDSHADTQPLLVLPCLGVNKMILIVLSDSTIRYASSDIVESSNNVINYQIHLIHIASHHDEKHDHISLKQTQSQKYIFMKANDRNRQNTSLRHSSMSYVFIIETRTTSLIHLAR